jgi:hypothetical protein
MPEVFNSRREQIQKRLPAMAAANERANRDALLKHARMGRSVCDAGPNGTVVWIEPKEIFARYRIDKFGRPAT